MAEKAPQTGWNRIMGSMEMVATAVFVLVVLLIFIPLPAAALDMFLVLNITFSLVVLLVTLYTLEPLQFSVFPSLLLVATLMRLGLNVAASRLILTHGNEGSNAAGRVIEAFGNTVGGNEPVVGFVIFLILVVIQFIVITNGAQRVSEVAARFTLDAMPGKQMAIDADLNAGLINEEEARFRRHKIQREADFYGAMDGASKFVRGDAIAAIVVVVINIIGGFAIGLWRQGTALSIGQILERYTLLTIGDGLVTQVPALFFATATGLIVTRAASDSSLGADMARQVFAQPRALAIATGVLLVTAAFFPGWSKLPLALIAVLMGGMAYYLYSIQRSDEKVRLDEEKKPAPKEPENVAKLLGVDPMELEIGFGLIPLVDETQGGDLLDRITMIRRQNALDLGLVVPPIRIHDNIQLPSEGYAFKIRGAEVARGELMTSRLLAINSTGSLQRLEGTPTKEPTFGLPALWIKESARAEAESKGYAVVDLPSVIATHLMEIIRNHAADLLSRQEVTKLLDSVKAHNAAVVEELIPGLLTVGDLQKVLQNLLKERVPIRDLVTILETLADHARTVKDTDMLTEYVRQALYRVITKAHLGPDNAIHAITLDPLLEQSLLEGVQRSDRGSFLSVDPKTAQQIFGSLSRQIESLSRTGHPPLVLCSPVVRPYFRRLVEKVLPNLIVLSYNELDPKTEIQSAGMVSIHHANQAV